jgi:hypothetical protein
MVSSGNFDHLRAWNFGGGVLVNPLKPEYIRAEIARYDPADAARVCQRVRQEAGLETATRRWITLYTEVIEEFRGLQPHREAELHAVAAYLRKWNYDKGIEAFRAAAQQIRKIPIVGNSLHRLGRKFLRNRADGKNLP